MHHILQNGSSTLVTAAILQNPHYCNNSTPSKSPIFHLDEGVTGILTLTTLWRLLFILLVFGNLKNLPFMWHLRIVNGFRFCLRSQRPKVPPSPAQIFQPLITTSQCPLMEIDFNLHKTNSSYFSDIDIARTHLVCTLFSTAIEEMRGGTAAITGSKEPVFNFALGAVSCSFKREIKPYETYDMWTRIISWDEKWIYLATHFVRKGSVRPRSYALYPEQNGCGFEELSEVKDCIVASALSKCVFKQGRKTISPEYMLKAAGLFPSEPILPTKNDIFLSSAANCGEQRQFDEKVSLSIGEKIELERQRGMKIASSLAAQGQQALEMEFRGDGEALGRHTDGTGLTGVVSTLCQLAHLKKDQIL